MSRLAEFLNRTTVPGGVLPLVHTTAACLFREIRGDSRLLTTFCENFGEDLLYFFVGRPAYKYRNDGSEPDLPELPCCLIFKYTEITNIKRVFPFDSGAFLNGLLPSYISIMKLNNFEASSAPDAVSRIIGAFFGSPLAYFNLKPRPQEDFERDFQVDFWDFEVKALHRLAREKSSSNKYDDRRFAIELQSSNEIDFSVKPPIAVVAPCALADEIEDVVAAWGAVLLPYTDDHIYSLEFAYGRIYETVNKFLDFRR